MQLRVISITSPLQSPKVSLEPLIPGPAGRTLEFGVDAPGHLFPYGQEYSGELILIEQYERPQYGFGPRSDLPGMGRVYVVAPPVPQPQLKSLWLGRLQASWPGEPVIAEIWPILSNEEESQPRRYLTLSALLHELFTTSWLLNPITLHLGTSPSLTALQRCCQEVRLSLSGLAIWSMLEAVLGLNVASAELGVCAPYISSCVPRAIADIAAKRAALEKEQQAAQAAFDAARQSFESAQGTFIQNMGELNERERLIEGWLALNPEAVTIT